MVGMLDRLTRINIYVLSQPKALVIGFVTFILVVAADYLTTYELSLAPFYLFVIVIVTWNCGARWGLVFSLLSFAAQIKIGILTGYPYSKPVYFYLDNANRLISYLVALGLASQLRIQHEREKVSARLDYLTGVCNQKGFYEAFSIEIARHRREMRPLSIAYLDCDNFKEANDRFGHKEGDRLLKSVAQTLRANLRKTDVKGRLGGDEFAIVLANTDKNYALNAIDKLKRELDAIMAAHSWPVTFSIGLGVFVNVPDSEDEMISFTDKLMYRVKSSGKNNILAQIFGTSEHERPCDF
jgi:diguanylate cyclase (GGDEF)-like protein